MLNSKPRRSITVHGHKFTHFEQIIVNAKRSSMYKHTLTTVTAFTGV